MNRSVILLSVLLSLPVLRLQAQSVLIGNETIGLNVTASGSAIGGAMQYPPGTDQGYLEAYWLRYNGQAYRSEWPLPAPGAIRVTEIEPMHYTSSTPDQVEAVGRTQAGQIEVRTVGSALSGRNWLRLVYTLTNTGTTPVGGLRFFQFADVDVGPAGIGGATPENADDTARYVADLNTVYTTDNVANPATDPAGLTIGIMSPVPPDHHDVYGGPNADYPQTFANPAYYNLANDTLDDTRIEFTGDTGMTMEWDIGTLLPGQSVSIPVYFFGALNEEDVPDIYEEVAVIPVAIDVKPGSSVNPVDLTSLGVQPVALLSTEDFAADLADPASLLLGDPVLPGRIAPLRWVMQDVNRDGLSDLMLHFSTPALVAAGAIDLASTSLELTGKTRGGVAIRGEDAIRIVPPQR